MQNLHDDNHMDELSRRAAEEFEPDHELHSWEKLRPPLDVAMPQKERKRRFIFFILLFLLVGGGVIMSGEWDEKGVKAPGGKSNSVSKTIAPEKSISVKKATKTNESVVTNNDDVTKPGSELTESSKNKILAEHKPVRNNKRIASKTTGGFELQSSGTKIQSSGNKVKESQQAKDKKSEQTVSEPIAQKTPETTSAKTAKAEPEKNPIPKAEPEKTPETETKTPPTPKKQKVNSRWEFGAVFAPDVSTVKFTHTQPPGLNFGLSIGYNFNKRWSVQTGVLYTSKNYKSYGKDYHPPKGYWTDYVKLETVTAECDMWDIPVNVRYNIAPRKSSNIFASAGLSSYLMKKEDYNFFYYYNGNPVNRFRSYYSDEHHWFSVLNLSVGYERKINKHFSVQAEPFFKQPLKGVGFGSVKLNTTGIFFSVKYKPLTTVKQQVKR